MDVVPHLRRDTRPHDALLVQACCELAVFCVLFAGQIQGRVAAQAEVAQRRRGLAIRGHAVLTCAFHALRQRLGIVGKPVCADRGANLFRQRLLRLEQRQVLPVGHEVLQRRLAQAARHIGIALDGGIALRLRFRPHAHAFQKQAARLLGESRGTDLKQCGKRYAPTHRIGHDQGFSRNQLDKGKERLAHCGQAVRRRMNRDRRPAVADEVDAVHVALKEDGAACGEPGQRVLRESVHKQHRGAATTASGIILLHIQVTISDSVNVEAGGFRLLVHHFHELLLDPLALYRCMCCVQHSMPATPVRKAPALRRWLRADRRPCGDGFASNAYQYLA